MRQHSDDDLLDVLRQAHATQPKLTVNAYTALAREHEWPGAMTHQRRFGTWNAALEAAGIPPAHAPHNPRHVCMECDLHTYARRRCASHYVAHMELLGHQYVHGSSRYVFVNRNGERVREHVAVMEAILGRSLLPGESVHHKGSSNDNRPSKLELRVGAHGPGWTVPEAVSWAHEILARYEP